MIEREFQRIQQQVAEYPAYSRLGVYGAMIRYLLAHPEVARIWL